MAKVLLIKSKEIKAQTVLGGNIDAEKFTENIRLAQDLELMPILGESMYNKLEELFIAGSGVIADPKYKVLFEDYITRGLIYLAAAQFTKLYGDDVNNGGVNKYNPTNGENSSDKSRYRMTSELTKIGNTYMQRMKKFLLANIGDYPEYSEHVNGQVSRKDEMETPFETPSRSADECGYIQQFLTYSSF